jgi:hypothetical protein
MSGVLADKSEARGSERESECVVETRFLWIIRVHAQTSRLLFAVRTDLPLKSRPLSSIRMKGIHPNTCARTLPDTSIAPYTTNYAQSTSRVNLPMSEPTRRRALREIESPNYNVAESLRSSDVDFRAKDTRLPVKGPKVTWFDQNLQEMPNFRSARYNFGSSSSTQVRRNPRRVESTATLQLDATSAYGNSFQVMGDQLPGNLDPSCLEERVDAAQSMLQRLGFTSAWDLVLVIVEGHSSQSTKDCADQSFTTDCAEKIIDYVLPHTAPAPLCAASSRVYKAEWDYLRCADALPQKLDPSNLSHFDFGRMYKEMQTAAPNLVGFFDHLSNPTTTSLAVERSRQRYVVMALAQLAHRNNSNANYIQTMIGLHLYASNVPKRFFPALNHLGISVSDSTTHRQLEKAAEEQR